MENFLKKIFSYKDKFEYTCFDFIPERKGGQAMYNLIQIHDRNELLKISKAHKYKQCKFWLEIIFCLLLIGLAFCI